MKKIVLLGAMLGTLFLAACENKENSTPTTPVEVATFRVESVIQGIESPQLDENGAGKFTQGDVNTLFFQNQQNEFLHTFYYTYGNKYLWSDVKGLDPKTPCQVSACYPKVLTDTPEQFEWNLQSQTQYPDFLIAAPVAANPQSSDPVNLTFKHALHKLQVKLVSGEAAITSEDLAQAQIVVSKVKMTAVLDLLQGKATGTTGNLTNINATGKENSFLLPAQPVDQIVVSIQMGSVIRQVELANCKVGGQPLTHLESGKSFILTISVTAEKILVLDQQIAGWEDQGTSNEDIII